METTPDICETFRSLAFRTFDQMGRARRLHHQPLEETFTDMNILELKERHRNQIFSKTFNKHQEGISGADWEWWLTNSSCSNWLGLRIQAKILNLSSNKFEHLHYKKNKTYQSAKLKRHCAKEGLVPLYCFYSHHAPTEYHAVRCRSFPPAPESYGCAISPLSHIERLRKNSETNDFASVIKETLPWHCLVCCTGWGGHDLPSHAWAMLQAEFRVKPKRSKKENIHTCGLRKDPPGYVQAVMRGNEFDFQLPDIRGVVIIKEASNT